MRARPTRRQVLTGAAAIGAIAAAGAGTRASAQITAATSLGAHYAAKGLYFGAALGPSAIDDDAYRLLFAQQCKILVPENNYKWTWLSSRQGQYDFSALDRMLDWGRINGMALRGHTLVWHDGLPDWFNTVATRSNAQSLITTHVTTLASRYRGLMHSIDVANEIVQPLYGRADGLRESSLLTLLGPTWFDIPFHAARAADPNALLFYNDYDVEKNLPEHETKRTFVLRTIEGMLRRGVPIHGFGLQSHLSPGWTAADSAALRPFLANLTAMGLKIMVTELDVNDQTLTADIATRDLIVGLTYRDFLMTMMEQPSFLGALTWGLGAKYSWIGENFPRADRLANRPLPYDVNLQRTTAWYGVLDARSYARP